MITEPEPKPAPHVAVDSFHAAAKDCHLTFLTGKKGAGEFLDLHKDVFWGMPASQRSVFLKYLSYPQLLRALMGGHHLLGLYSPDHVMLAQARVTFPELPGTSNLEAYPFGSTLKKEDCAVIQSLGVHPKTNGNGGLYIKEIFDGAKGVAEGENCRYLLGKISFGNDNDTINNHRSHKTFIRNHFTQMTQPAFIGSDTYKSVFMVRDLTVPVMVAP